MRRLAGILVAAVLTVAPSVATATEPGDVESGRDLFVANCAMCHGEDASGMMGMHPSLRGALGRLTAEGVEVTIRNGRDTSPPMPAFGGRLRDDEIGDLVAYIDSLPPGPRNFGPGGGVMGDGMMGGWMWVWPVVGLLALAAVVAAVVVAVRSSSRSPAPSPTARDVLDRRYAGGRISREEYLRARADLEDEQADPPRPG